MMDECAFTWKRIGTLRTPYQHDAPYQPVHDADGEFYAEMDAEYVDGLNQLGAFHCIYLLYFADRISRDVKMMISPPWVKGKEVGVFSSRSPVRPNPIGLSVVRIKKIIRNRVYTSGLDVFDETPLLDIKPYIKDLDDKVDANLGWIGEIEDKEHLTLHIKGIPHDY